MEEILDGISGSLLQFREESDKYGEGYATANLVSYLESVLERNGRKVG